MNIFEAKITAKNVRAIWEADADNRPPYLGEAFFPNTKQLGLELNLIKGKQGLPVALVSANWDTDVLYRDRIGFTSLQAELPFFKEAYKISEKLRQQILTTTENYQTPLFNEIFNDSQELLDGAEVTAERMRMQLLGTGTISIQENGVDKQYDYGFNSSTQFVTESTLWTASGAHPFKSFVAQLKNYKNLTKKAPKVAIFGYDAYQLLINDADIISYFESLTTPLLAPTDDEIHAYIERRSGVRVIVNDAQYVKARDNTKTPVYFFPADRYTILSTVDMGETVYGTTPEEADLLGGNSNILDGEVLEKGVAITTWKETDPVSVSIKVSEVVAPSCPNIDKIYIVKVKN